MTGRIARPNRDPYWRIPERQANSALRSAEDAIYTHKNALAEEHFLRTGHEANIAVECETCELIVAGTSSDPRKK